MILVHSAKKDKGINKPKRGKKTTALRPQFEALGKYVLS